MAVNQQLLPTLRFSALNRRERLFLYLVRHWGYQLSKRLKAGKGDKGALAPLHARDVSLDVFMRCFGASLPEPLMLKPPQCRCNVEFHEATLLAIFRSGTNNDAQALNHAIADMMPRDAIERLGACLRPLVSEIELALAELF